MKRKKCIIISLVFVVGLYLVVYNKAYGNWSTGSILGVNTGQTQGYHPVCTGDKCLYIREEQHIGQQNARQQNAITETSRKTSISYTRPAGAQRITLPGFMADFFYKRFVENTAPKVVDNLFSRIGHNINEYKRDFRNDLIHRIQLELQTATDGEAERLRQAHYLLTSGEPEKIQQAENLVKGEQWYQERLTTYLNQIKNASAEMYSMIQDASKSGKVLPSILMDGVFEWWDGVNIKIPELLLGRLTSIYRYFVKNVDSFDSFYNNAIPDSAKNPWI